MLDDPRSWLLLDLRCTERPWALDVHDEKGIQHSLEWPDDDAVREVVGKVIDERIRSTEGEMPPPLPVFARRVRRAPEFHRRLATVLKGGIETGHVSLVPLARRDFRIRSPFRLPIDVAAIGNVDERILEPLLREHWRSLPEVETHGMRVGRLDVGTWAWRRAAGDLDIVVSDAEGAVKVLRDVSPRTWPPRHPRLLFVVCGHDEVAALARRSLPAALSLVLVPLKDDPQRAGVILLDLALGLVHDQPLHSCVANATVSARLPGARRPWLIADPSSNWALSVGDAYRDVRQRGVSALVAARAIDPRTFSSAAGQPTRLVETAMESLHPDFVHETSGFAPTARASIDVASLEGHVADALRRLPAREAYISERQQRSVDIELQRTGPAGSAPHDPRDPRLVLPGTELAASRSYVLRVAIGVPLAGSLFRESPPAVDAVLEPSRDGHLLDITVFGMDFTLESARVVQRRLPALGPIAPATFAIRTPPAPGLARLRVVISYLDHILHSYVVRATIAVHERLAAEAASLLARLEFATSQRFANLDRVGQRGAAILVNDGPEGEGRIAMKRGLDTFDTRFDAEDMRKMRISFRELLKEATADDGTRFPDRPATTPAARTARGAHYDALMRKLAIFGAKIRSDLSALGQDARALLREIQDAEGLTLQVVEAKRGGSLPWVVVYDGLRPEGELDEMENWPLCRGFDDQGPCRHRFNDTAGLICLRRMWGVRHQIELRLAEADTKDDKGAKAANRLDAITRVGTAKGRDLEIGVGTSSASALDEPSFPSAISEVCQLPHIERWSPTDSVYHRLDNARRARVVAILGHLEVVESKSSKVSSTTIDLSPKLSESGLNQLLDRADWGEPNSIVLLLACSSNEVPRDALTNLVDSFLSARAAAVVGTETVVFARLSARFLKLLYGALSVPGATFVEAMTETRLTLLRELSPLALSFVGWGSADLVLVEAIGGGGS